MIYGPHAPMLSALGPMRVSPMPFAPPASLSGLARKTRALSGLGQDDSFFNFGYGAEIPNPFDPVWGSTFTDGGASGSGFDWNNLIRTIGSTFNSSWNTVNNPQLPAPPASGSAYSGASDTGAGTTAASGDTTETQAGLPWNYLAIGGAALVAVMLIARPSGG